MKTVLLFLTWLPFLGLSIWCHSTGGPIASLIIGFVYLTSILFILSPKTIHGRPFSKKITLHYIILWLGVVLSLAAVNALGDAVLAVIVSTVGAFLILFLKDIGSLIEDEAEMKGLAEVIAGRFEELERRIEDLANASERSGRP